MRIKVESLEDTQKLAQIFASCINKKGLFATLTGDIGAGKTQFIRFVLKFLEVKDSITSPSFVILNEYKTDKFPIYHFDLYRLEKNGLNSIVNELREYSKEGKVTFIEWAEFGQEEIPKNALKIKVEYDNENLDIRYYSFESLDNNFYREFEKKVNNEYTKH